LSLSKIKFNLKKTPLNLISKKHHKKLKNFENKFKKLVIKKLKT
jgi:hypothetical protein